MKANYPNESPFVKLQPKSLVKRLGADLVFTLSKSNHNDNDNLTLSVLKMK
jgi:hypothetical protein